MLEGIMVNIWVALIPPANEIYYFHWWIDRKNKSISSTQGVGGGDLKSILICKKKIVRKKLFFL